MLPLQNFRVNIPILKAKHRVTARKDWTQVILVLSRANIKPETPCLTWWVSEKNLLCSKGLEQPLCCRKHVWPLFWLAPFSLKLSMVAIPWSSHLQHPEVSIASWASSPSWNDLAQPPCRDSNTTAHWPRWLSGTFVQASMALYLLYFACL